MSTCKDKINQFCFVCSRFTIKNYAINIDLNIIKLYKKCFGISMRNVDSDFSPDIICKICLNMMERFVSGNGNLTIVKPAQWRDPRDPKDHDSECFACRTRTTGINHKHRDSIAYKYGYMCTKPVFSTDDSANGNSSQSSSAINSQQSKNSELPTQSSMNLRSSTRNFQNDESQESDNENPPSSPFNVSFFTQQNDVLLNSQQDPFSSEQDPPSSQQDPLSSPYHPSNFRSKPQGLTQELLNDFVNKMGLGKKKSMATGKFLNDYSCLRGDVHWSFFGNRETELIDYFDETEDGTPYCNDIECLIEDWFGYKYHTG